MALTFPLSLSDFFDLAKVKETTFWLPSVAEGDVLGSGEIVQVANAPRLWEGRVSYPADEHDAIDLLVSRAYLLLSPGATFLVRPRQRSGPIGGVTSGLGGVTISSVNANMRDLSLAGLPANFSLQQGSYLSFVYSGRQAFHQIVVGAIATALGAATVEVTPPIRAGYAAGAAVTLVNPVCKAVMKSDSFQASRQRAGATDGFTFEWRQTLRA